MGVEVSDAASDDGLLTGAGRAERSPTARPPRRPALEKGDVITKVDDVIIPDSDSLVAMIRGHRPGDKVTLTVVRDGKPRTVQVTLDED